MATELSGEQTKRLDECIDRIFPQSVTMLEEMVSINSVNPIFWGVNRAEVIGGETACSRLIGKFLEQYGYRSATVSPDSERENTIAYKKGAGGGRSAFINGHVDTVAPFRLERWKTGNPWKPHRDGDRLYGLGTTDMKSGLVAGALAAAALEAAGIQLKGELQIHAVVGEETMSHEYGTSAVLDAGFGGEFGIVVEPTAQPEPLTISPVSAGNFNMYIDVPGRATHCGNRAAAIRAGGIGADAGVNAVEKAIGIIHALQHMEQEWGISKPHPAFPAGFFSVSPNMIRGDAGVPSVGYFAENTRIGYLVWWSPNDTADSVIKEIEAQVHHAAQLDSWLRNNPPIFEWQSCWPPSNTSPDHPFVRQMVSDRAVVLGPTPAGLRDTSGFNACCDATFIEAKGIPTVIFGPGDLTQAHAIDEFVNLSEVRNCARILGRSLAAWCGVA